MSNKKIIKKVFDEELDSKKMKQQILLKYERKERYQMSKIIKYSIASVCLLLVAFIGISLSKGTDILENNIIGAMKVYAYTISEDKKIEKTELKDKI